MSLEDVGSYTLGELNIGLTAGMGLLNPLMLQFELLLTGQFGIGGLLLDLQSQLTAALALNTSLTLSITNPIAAIMAMITAVAQLQASLSVALSLGLPVVSLQIGLQISAALALAASLSLKLGGIQAQISAGLAVKIPMLKFMAQMSAALSAGPIHLLSFTGDNLALTGAQIAGMCASGLGPDDPIYPAENVSGIMIVTKDPAVFAALGAILKVN